MATKPKAVKKEKVTNPEVEVLSDGREAVIVSEPDTTFEERTQVSQPWAEVQAEQAKEDVPVVEGE